MQVAAKAHEWETSVDMPRIGCGLAGDDCSNVEPLIRANLTELDVAVTVYDFESQSIVRVRVSIISSSTEGPSRNGVALRTRAEVCPCRRTL